MTGFVIVGDGFPARRVAEAVAAAPGARVLALVPGTRLGSLATPPEDGAAPLGGRVLASAAGAERLRAFGAEWLLNVNSTVIIPPEILALFPGRALNAHPGLLPEYAGLHVHQWAIRNGESEFGVTVHVMVPAIDAGPVVAVRRFAVQPNDTGLSLFRRCQAASAELLTEVATRIARGEALTLQPQDLARRHVYRHRDALDGAIDWRMPARAIIDFVRAGNYEPFVSPTYVASMPSASGTIVEVLRARIDESADAPPGTLLGLSDDGPRIACGDRETIRLIRARSGGRVLGPAEWRSFFEAHGCDSLG